MIYRLETATAAHAEVLGQIARRAFDSETVEAKIHRALGTQSWPEGPDRPSLSNKYFALTEDDRPIGMTGLYQFGWVSSAVFYLGWFFIDPSVQGKGLGRVLLQATMGLAVGYGGETLCIETAPNLDKATALYRSCGFLDGGAVPNYWGQGSDLLLMYGSLAGLDPLSVPEGTALELWT